MTGRFIFTVESCFIVPDKVTGGGYDTKFSGKYGAINLGYLLHSKSSLNIYPLAGIGFGNVSLQIIENSALGFNETLDNPRRGSSLRRFNLLIDLGLGIDYLVTGNKDKRGKKGFSFGVRTGYSFAPYKHDWLLFDRKVPGSKKTGIEGFYIRGMFGIGR
jgi:hypothetical protein